MKLKKFTALCLSAVISLSGSTYATEQSSNFPIKKVLLYSSPLLVLVPVVGYAAFFELIPSKKVHHKSSKPSSKEPSGSKEKFGQKTNSNHQNPNEISQERFYGWIKLLSGETTNDRSFIYKSGEDFRNDNDTNLEKYHNFIQVFFPNVDQSGSANCDLFIDNCRDKWKALLENNSEIFKKIQSEMHLNLLRMLKFWKFNASYDGNNNFKVSLPKPFKSQLRNPSDHNCLRATRVLIALRLFDLNEEYAKFLDILNTFYPNHESKHYWNNNTKNIPSIKVLLEI